MAKNIFIRGEFSPQPFKALGITISSDQTMAAWFALFLWIGLFCCVIAAFLYSNAGGDADKQQSFNLSVASGLLFAFAQLLAYLYLFTRYTSITYGDLHSKYIPL
jgi:uncharacterized membrane protein YkvI